MSSRLLALGFLKSYPDILELVDIQDFASVPAGEPAWKVSSQRPNRSRVVPRSQDLPRLCAHLLVIDDIQIIAKSIDHRFEEIDVARQRFARLIHVDTDVAQPDVRWLQLTVERLLDERCLADTLKTIHDH